MKITGKVLNTFGKQHTGLVAVVAWQDGQLVELGGGKITKGKFAVEIDKELGPVWGLVIDGKPALATVETASKDAMDMGSLQVRTTELQWPLFHAPDGVVFAAPAALNAAIMTGDLGESTLDSGGGDKPISVTLPTDEVPPPASNVKLSKAMSLTDVLDNTSTQLSAIQINKNKKFVLKNANLTLKGLATSLEGDKIGIEFPPTDTAAPAGNLSELTFTFKPNEDWEPLPYPFPGDEVPLPTGPAPVTVPHVTGYTRELATRKIVAAGLAVEASHEIVYDPAKAGVVTRQLPAAGMAQNGRVRIFIGKLGEY